MYTGSKIIRDGLVLHFDPANVKSYRGEETVNLANTNEARTLNFHDGYGHAGAGSSLAPEKGVDWYKFQISHRGSNMRIAQFPYISLVINVVRTYSVEIDFGTTNGYMIYGDGSVGIGQAIYLGNNKYSITFFDSSGTGLSLALFLYNNTYNCDVNDTIYYRYYQVENKSYATTFTPASRGTTVATNGGLIDISPYDNHGEIISSNAQKILYNKKNCGSLLFDGVDDYIKTNYGKDINTSTHTLTISIWFRMLNLSDATIFLSGGQYRGNSDINQRLYLGVVGGMFDWGIGIYGWGAGNAISSTNLNWNNITIVVGSNAKSYFNGVYINTINSSVILNDSIWLGVHDEGSYCSNINISDTKIYNRALSSTEILQNYNATKTRYLPQIITDGLILNLDASDISSYPRTGSTWRDLSGNANNGTLVNGVGYSNEKEGVMVFDGVDDYGAVSHNANQVSTNFTICVWVKSTLNDAPLQQLIVTKANLLGTEYGWMLRKGDYNTAGNRNKYYFSAYYGNHARFDILVYSNVEYTDNNWHYLVGVFNGGISQSLFIDGVKQTATRIPIADCNMTTTPVPITIQGYGDSFVNYGGTYYSIFRGNVGNVLYYTKALSAEEVLFNYNSTKNQYL